MHHPWPSLPRGGQPWSGIAEATVVVASFIAFGLVYAAALAPPGAGLAYPAPAMGDLAPRPRVWLVDGYNVLCAGLLGGRSREDWWTEARRRELLGRLEQLDDAEAEVWVVFDAAEPRELGAEAGRVRTVFAPSADAWLLAQVRARAAGADLVVVTADRPLAGRARHRGAQVVSPRELLRRCRGLPSESAESSGTT
jgi:predicted RNA-binding protein with PIN domain